MLAYIIKFLSELQLLSYCGNGIGVCEKRNGVLRTLIYTGSLCNWGGCALYAVFFLSSMHCIAMEQWSIWACLYLLFCPYILSHFLMTSNVLFGWLLYLFVYCMIYEHCLSCSKLLWVALSCIDHVVAIRRSIDMPLGDTQSIPSHPIPNYSSTMPHPFEMPFLLVLDKCNMFL